MFAVKRRLKLNTQEKAKLASHAGFSRFVYNYGLSLFWQSVDAGMKASDTKRLDAIKKCFTNVTKKRAGFEWTQELSSKVYQSAFRALSDALKRWRKGYVKQPVYKRRKHGQSFTVYDGNGMTLVKQGKLQYHNRNKRFGDRRTGEKASNNAKKHFKKVARLHRDIANQRKDFLSKTTTSICRKYAHIRIEDLNVSGMIANCKLSQAISDLGFYEFRRQLTYKALCFGCQLDIVDRWFPSSKTCRKCSYKHSKLKLSDRIFVCPNCGHTEDRDLQAAKNLANAPDELCNRVGSPRIYACGQVAADCLG